MSIEFIKLIYQVVCDTWKVMRKLLEAYKEGEEWTNKMMDTYDNLMEHYQGDECAQRMAAGMFQGVFKAVVAYQHQNHIGGFK